MSEPDNFQALNKEFYNSTPSTYFRDRLKLLSLRAAAPDAIEAAFGDHFTWGQIRIERDDDGDEAQDPNAAAFEEAAHTRFVATESQVLLHHAAEALLRMFLAHAGRPECPWLRMSALLNHRKFRTEAAKLAQPTWPTERINVVADVFLGGVPRDPAPEWIQHRDTAVRLMRLLARRLDSDKNLYNAAKHGLTSLGGTGWLHFIPDDPEQSLPDAAGITVDLLENRGIVAASGVNVVYLEREGAPESGYTWFHKTQWLCPEQAAALTHLIIIQMDALWTVAKIHYLGETPPKQLRLVNGAAIDAIHQFARGGPVQSFRRMVAVEYANGSQRPPSPENSEDVGR